MQQAQASPIGLRQSWWSSVNVVQKLIKGGIFLVINDFNMHFVLKTEGTMSVKKYYFLTDIPGKGLAIATPNTILLYFFYYIL